MDRVCLKDFINKYTNSSRFDPFKKENIIPFQNRGYIFWCRVCFPSHTIEASTLEPFTIGFSYTYIYAGSISEDTRPNFRVLDKVNMDLYGAKVQEVYA